MSFLKTSILEIKLCKSRYIWENIVKQSMSQNLHIKELVVKYHLEK